MEGNEAFELKTCFREVSEDIHKAAKLLNDAVSAHILGNYKRAEDLILDANIRSIAESTETVWGKGRLKARLRRRHFDVQPILPKALRCKDRMPTPATKAEVLRRDGFHCRVCNIPVIQAEVRSLMRAAYPRALPWAGPNKSQHAAFQAMWLSFDHVLHHSRGGCSLAHNIIVTCAPCNFGRAEFSFEQVGLLDPCIRMPFASNWDGLERFRNFANMNHASCASASIARNPEPPFVPSDFCVAQAEATS